jgi:hypothetical protein
MRDARPTVRILPLPSQWHPIWGMGQRHVLIAHALCSALSVWCDDCDVFRPHRVP